MDAFNQWLANYGDYLRLASVILSVAAAVITIITLLLKHKKGLLKKLLEWATDSFADGKITKEEFSNLMEMLKSFKASEEKLAENEKKEEQTTQVIADKKTGKVKREKAKKVKLKQEKDTVNKWNAIIKDATGAVIFTADYVSKFKARKGIKKALQELVKENKNPASYKLTKIAQNAK